MVPKGGVPHSSIEVVSRCPTVVLAYRFSGSH
jgi:hypothetical protein